MRMLDDLKNELDTIESDNDWEFQFVTDILIRTEKSEAKGEKYKLSGKQFEKLNQIHQKHILHTR